MADFIDKAQHKAEEIAGEAKESLGKATGSDELRRDGAGDKAKAGAHQVADKASDKADEVADKAGDLADKASDKAQDVAKSVTDFADHAAAQARDLDVESVAHAAQSPRVLAIAAALVGAGVVAVLLSRRNSRRASRDLPHIVARSRRAARTLARDARL